MAKISNHSSHFLSQSTKSMITYAAIITAKRKGTLICIAPHRTNPWSAQVWITEFLHCKAHHTCLPTVHLYNYTGYMQLQVSDTGSRQIKEIH